MLLSIRTLQEDDSKPPDIFNQVTLSFKNLSNCRLEGFFWRKTSGKPCKLMLFDSYLLLKEDQQYLRMELDMSIGLDFDTQALSISLEHLNQPVKNKEVFIIENSKDLDSWVSCLRSKVPRSRFHEHYKIQNKESQGKNSTVYRVTRLIDGQTYAAKATNMNSNLQEEIRILSLLDHPNLIHFKEFYVQPESVYIIMDYQNGGTLLDLIRSEVPVSDRVRTKIFLDVLNGLEFLRIKGIVHRDLKPENILFNKDEGNYKIADFGLASGANKAFVKIAGTPGYIAPEIFSKSQEEKMTDIKSDIYSAGLIFYELITKERFYNGKSTNEVLKCNMKGKSSKNIKHQNVQDLDKELLSNMLRRDPKKRKDSYSILKSSVVNKLSHLFNLRTKGSTTDSTGKGNSTDSDEESHSSGFMSAMKNLLKIRSSSN